MIDRLVNDYYQDPSVEKLTVVREVDMQTMHYDIGMDYFARNTKLSFAGFSMDEIRSIYHIYDLIHPSDLDRVFQWTRKVIDFSNKHVDLNTGLESQLLFRVIGKHRKIYYINRQSIVNRIDSKGKLATNVTSIHDLSWMKPSNLGNGKLIGNGAELFDQELPELATFKGELTTREIGVLQLIARGFRSPDIGNMLHISKHTVSTHRKNMLKKLEVANTPELLTLARDMGLI